MTARATISFDDDNFQFLKKRAGKSRSAFINQLLREERQRQLAAALLRANQEEAEDPDYGAEWSAWDAALADGLNDEP